MRTAIWAVCELEHVNPRDVETWNIGRDDSFRNGWQVRTSFNVARFGPSWGQPGEPHHFETQVVSGAGYVHETYTYRTEAEARAGHAVVCGRVRTQLEAA